MAGVEVSVRASPREGAWGDGGVGAAGSDIACVLSESDGTEETGGAGVLCCLGDSDSSEAMGGGRSDGRSAISTSTVDTDPGSFFTFIMGTEEAGAA